MEIFFLYPLSRTKCDSEKFGDKQCLLRWFASYAVEKFKPLLRNSHYAHEVVFKQFAPICTITSLWHANPINHPSKAIGPLHVFLGAIVSVHIGVNFRRKSLRRRYRETCIGRGMQNDLCTRGINRRPSAAAAAANNNNREPQSQVTEYNFSISPTRFDLVG